MIRARFTIQILFVSYNIFLFFFFHSNANTNSINVTCSCGNQIEKLRSCLRTANSEKRSETEKSTVKSHRHIFGKENYVLGDDRFLVSFETNSKNRLVRYKYYCRSSRKKSERYITKELFLEVKKREKTTDLIITFLMRKMNANFVIIELLADWINRPLINVVY